MGLPLVIGSEHSGWWQIALGLIHPGGTFAGTIMLTGGYAGTLWCYVAMGNAWRMGIDRKGKTDLIMTGPYRFVRHPIYLFQILMVGAIPVLLPSLPALILLLIHLACILTKVSDEENYLRKVLGEPYEIYRSSSGKWFPKFAAHKASVVSTPSTTPNQLKPAEQRLH
jgi:protein-S-isoprenylcysteine O-methyltransferase Ste14